MNKLEKLLSISSPAFVNAQSQASCLIRNGRDIQSMLDKKNGFTAFESALVVFPTVDIDSIPSLDSWNKVDGWRRWYGKCVPSEVVFFAEDIFGGQFGSSRTGIIRLDPESGEITHYADSLSQWAEVLLSNYSEDTGWPLSHEWQVVNGSIKPSQRLLPKQPFILGGDYTVDNLKLVDTKVAMDKWGQLYQVIKTIPDGQKISISGWIE